MNPIQSAVQNFLNHCRYEKNLSTKTIKAYSTDLLQFSAFIEAKSIVLIEHVTKVELRSFLEEISSLKAKSIKRKVATLKALFNFLEFDDLIAVNPWRKMKIRIKEPKVLPTVLDLSEVGRMLRSLYKRKQALEGKHSYAYKEVVRNITILELLFATGGRVSEIARLKNEDVSLQTGVIIIQGKGDKERIIQVCNEEVLSLLKHYRKIWGAEIASDGYFLINRFGNVLSDQSIRNLVKRVSKEAGIAKHVTPHVFRHSFATLLLEKDVDIKYIQSLLGHSSVNTTQIYTHVNKHKQRQLLKAKHPRRDLMMGDVVS
jgi:integrase/recombinase XerD